MNKGIEQRIRERAQEIYTYRIEHGLIITTDRLGNPRDITPEDDWLEAEDEILKRVRNDWR